MSFNPDLWRSRQIEFFDVLASLNKAIAQSPASPDPLSLFKIIQHHIQPLFAFEAHVFVAPNPETFEFEITLCDPPEALPLAQKTLDFTIEENTFSWSLKQNRAVTLRCDPLKKSLILHAIATQDNKYGMFMGITRLGGIHEMDFTLPMISAIIQRGAYSLERQKFNEKIRITKMEAIGLLAGGIAHNFNNVIQSIQGNIGLAQIELNESHPAHAFLANAENGCQRAGLLSNQLLTFAKGGAPIRKRFSIQHLLESITSDLQGEFSIPISISSSETDPQIDADENQLFHAFSQLLQNACEASPQDGKVEVHIQRHIITEDEITPISPGTYWEIEIKDHGTGIPEDSLSKVLEPYYTTKLGHSGLGLPTAFSILKNHGGHLEIHSVLHKGTSVKSHLPAPKETLPPPAPSLQKQSKTPVKIRVLHMDDEESLRNMMRALLQKYGYEVVSTCDGGEAIQAYQKSIEQSQKFDWVILDLMIPGGMGGAETITKLKEIDPSIRAMVCSGYSNDPVMSKPSEYGFKAVIKKPFQFQELLELLKSAT